MAAVVVGFAVGYSPLISFLGGPRWWLPWVVGTSGGLALLGLWAWSCRVPKCPAGRIGVAIAIRVETDTEEKRIRHDFIAAVASGLAKRAPDIPFTVFEVPGYLAPGVQEHEGACTLLERSRATLLLWGEMRTRKLGGQEHYCIRLHGAVAHKRVAVAATKDLAGQMRAAIPESEEIAISEELSGFEMTASNTDLAARYIVAMAAGLSGFIPLAKALLLSIQQDLPEPQKKAKGRGRARARNITAFEKSLRPEIPKRLAALALREYTDASHLWLRDKTDVALLAEAKERLTESAGYLGADANSSPVYLVPKAWLEMSLKANVQAASYYLRESARRAPRDPATMLSLAFVRMLEGQGTEALRLYDFALELDAPMQLIFQIEDYIGWWLETHPVVPEGLYLLSALLNLRAKRDFTLARQDLDRFDAACTTNTERALVTRARALRALMTAQSPVAAESLDP